jgi:hypothetical protein
VQLAQAVAEQLRTELVTVRMTAAVTGSTLHETQAALESVRAEHAQTVAVLAEMQQRLQEAESRYCLSAACLYRKV